ncbi:MAG: hypothetical protein SGVNAXEH_000762 [Holophagaceae bacterium]
MLAKDQTLGKYQILDRLGSGGFGSVYLALDTWINRKVAIKVPHQQEEEVIEMLKEPRIMSELKNLNIAEMITAERTNGIFFMVLEYIEGESLDKMIRREKKLLPELALDLAIGITSGVAFAHSKKVLHRDIRPANILITREGIAKVTDFGTSRILALTPAMTRVGSPPYMAPEHFRGLATFQSDIWSLGITFYEMLTGTVPFYDPDPLKIAQSIDEQRIISPHLKVLEVPKAFSEIIMKCLQVNLGERYASTEKLLNALKVMKENESRPANPLTTGTVSRTLSRVPAPKNSVTGKVCIFCYTPLARMSTVCPKCGELN